MKNSQEGFLKYFLILITCSIFIAGYFYLPYLPIGYFFGGPQKISGFPSYARSGELDRFNGSLDNEKKILTRQDTNLIISDLSTKKTHRIVGSKTKTVANAALGDGFAVWITITKDFSDKSYSTRVGKPIEFDLWGYDFNTDQEILLLKNFNNNNNGNSPSLAVSDRNIALMTFDHRLRIINFDTKVVKEIDTSIALQGHVVIPKAFVFISNFVVFSATTETSYSTDALIELNLTNNSFTTIRKINDGWQIGEIKINPNASEIYWQEHGSYFASDVRYFKIKI